MRKRAHCWSTWLRIASSERSLFNLACCSAVMPAHANAKKLAPLLKWPQDAEVDKQTGTGLNMSRLAAAMQGRLEAFRLQMLRPKMTQTGGLSRPWGYMG